MIDIFQFLPIIIVFILVGLITFIIIRNGNSLKRNRTKINQQNFVKRVQVMLSVYIAVLLISVGLFFLIPSEVDSTTGKRDESEYRFLHEALYSGNIPESYDTFIEKQWNYNVDGNQLTLEGLANKDGMYDIGIFVEEQQNLNDTIEVIYYSTPVTVDGMEVTDQVPPPEIELSSATMTIRNPDQVEINFTSFLKEFPFTQFTGGKWWDERINLGEQIILIRVPEGLELNYDSDIFVEYVGG